MARRRRSASPTAYTSVIAKPRLVRIPDALSSYRAALSLLEDRRQFHPLGPFRPATASPRRAARVVIKSPNRPFKRPDVFGFAIPDRVAICVRRNERRQVLFAKRKMRAGAGSRKRKNLWSSISCKR